MSKTTKPTFFYCYLDNSTLLNHLTDEQAGKLWKMLFDYTNNDVKTDISDPMLAMAFDVMVQQIDRDFKKYQDKCEKNRANAHLRKRPLANACWIIVNKVDKKNRKLKKFLSLIR